MVLLGHEANSLESSDEPGDIVFLPRGSRNLEDLDPRAGMAVFSWQSMLWLSFTNKALHGTSEEETRLVLQTFSAFKGKTASSGISPLDMTRSLDMDVTRNYLMMLYSRIGKLLASTPCVAGTGLDADTSHLLLLVCAGTASPNGKVSLPSLWAQIRREAERLARQAITTTENEATDRGDVELTMARKICAVIDDVIRFVVEDERKGDKSQWQAGKEWEGLMDLWIGLYRAVRWCPRIRRSSPFN